MTTRIYYSQCGKEMWIDCSHNPPPDEVDFEKVICADCMQGKKTKGFTTAISNLFGRLLGRE
jgi:hypothetical protein